MFRDTLFPSSRERLLERQLLQEPPVNSVSARIAAEQLQFAQRSQIFEHRRTMNASMMMAEHAAQEHFRRMNDPMFQMAMRAAEDAWRRKKDKSLWYYRRTTGIIDLESIRKAINRELERILPVFDPRSLFRRLSAALGGHLKCLSPTKIHSPPLRLNRKSLHPVDSVA